LRGLERCAGKLARTVLRGLLLSNGEWLLDKMHWVLDVQFKEDSDQKAERKSVRSFALLRRIALNIVRDRDKTPKRSHKRKLKMAGWDNDYLLSLLK